MVSHFLATVRHSQAQSGERPPQKLKKRRSVAKVNREIGGGQLQPPPDEEDRPWDAGVAQMEFTRGFQRPLTKWIDRIDWSSTVFWLDAWFSATQATNERPQSPFGTPPQSSGLRSPSSTQGFWGVLEVHLQSWKVTSKNFAGTFVFVHFFLDPSGMNNTIIIMSRPTGVLFRFVDLYVLILCTLAF